VLLGGSSRRVGGGRRLTRCGAGDGSVDGGFELVGLGEQSVDKSGIRVDPPGAHIIETILEIVREVGNGGIAHCGGNAFESVGGAERFVYGTALRLFFNGEQAALQQTHVLLCLGDIEIEEPA
jgi:hypothetical protein